MMKEIVINLPNKPYKAVVSYGLFQDVGKFIRERYNGKKIFLITDAHLGKLYGDRLIGNLSAIGFSVISFVLPPGESSKALSFYEKICEEFISKGISNQDLILAFGGGVVGDMAGFVAATLKRGLPYINVPTSLIAQTDSSIGGKTGLDLSLGKNLVGVYHHPLGVLVDPDLLQTLPRKYWRDGMAEVIKYALIKDEQLFRLLMEKNEDTLPEVLEEVIGRCLTIKAELVTQDERDKGARKLLNFGHTFGHALETYFDYDRLSHGEGVGLGMLRITRNSEKIGLTKKGTHDKILSILRQYHLPVHILEPDHIEVLEIIGRDKKTAGDKISLVILEDVGRGILHSIPISDMKIFFE